MGEARRRGTFEERKAKAPSKQARPKSRAALLVEMEALFFALPALAAGIKKKRRAPHDEWPTEGWK